MGKSTARSGKGKSLKTSSKGGKKLQNIPIPKRGRRKLSLVSDSSDSSLSEVSDEDSSDDDEQDSSDDDDEVDYVQMTATKKLANIARQSRGTSEEPLGSSDDDSDSESDLEIVSTTQKPKPEVIDSEEDIGEEIALSPSKFPPMAPTLEDQSLLDVPKIDETELNSDDDYELDKDQLIRTLQNDNDEVEIFGKSDDDLDFFLSGGQDIEEENYLLQEEADAILKDYHDPEVIGATSENSHTSASTNVSNTNSTGDATNEESKAAESDSSSSDEYDYDDVSDDFEMPWYDVFQNSAYHAAGKQDVDSDDDDSYLWPYFISGESSSDEDGTAANEKANGSKVLEDESGDSTDEDTTLPPPSTKKIGSKSAKEILSSSKNNFRAPVLGVWTTANQAKPFGIIDGFSTRSLEPALVNSGKGRLVSSSTAKPKFLGVQPIMELDELLYVDEFEEGEAYNDDNDEWERKVPLSAFRSKGVVDGDHSQGVRRYSASFTPSDRRRLKEKKPKSKSPKSARKSREFGTMPTDEIIITPVKSMKFQKFQRNAKKLKKHKNGLRSTKGGLFSESTLADVEALLVDLGDDDDFNILFGA
ncbi:unnamed protein product [Kuraishia capsulata CBS 1993]|uniref:Protein IFH1 n=1 Tax=Kuraishia capsulata CBS 1993 TaxID=1382522 RepID=W6MP07_9ASCO|nr:uncharacterized protein KUCA_T00002776001 [Kuraishia capsulata CBS 1993]CDK26802.1 unnamed protein product [Kuraishia capsulata CBS 1993]